MPKKRRRKVRLLPPPDRRTSKSARRFMRKIAHIGGITRAALLSPARRSEIARLGYLAMKAAQAQKEAQAPQQRAQS